MYCCRNIGLGMAPYRRSGVDFLIAHKDKAAKFVCRGLAPDLGEFWSSEELTIVEQFSSVAVEDSHGAFQLHFECF